MHQACLFFFPMVITRCCFLFMFPLVVCGVPPLSTHQQHRPSVLGSPRVSAWVLGCSRPAAEFLWGAKCRRVGLPSFCCGALEEIKHFTQTQEGLLHGRAAAWSPAEVPAPQPWVRFFLGLLELSGKLRLCWAMLGSWSIFEFHWASALQSGKGVYVQ